MRNKIVIQKSTATRNSMGEEILTWSTFDTVWASKAHRSSREFYSAQKVNAEIQDLFIIRYHSGIDTKMRVSFDGKLYNIIGANDPDGRWRETHLVCRAVEGVT